jgi:uncharacterized protein
MKMRRCFVVLGLLLSVSVNVMAGSQDIPPEKRAAIDKLLDLTGAVQLGQQLSSAMVTQLSNSLRATHANIPKKALDVLPEVVNGVVAENIGGFREIIIRVYDEHLTLEDVNGLTQFYSTDLGRKVIKILPGILQESMVAGQKWGQSLAPEIARRIQARFQKEGISL